MTSGVRFLIFAGISCMIAADDTVKTLLKQLQSDQYNETVPYNTLVTWAKHEGLWESGVHINQVGNAFNADFRQYLSCPDNNMFASAFIIEVMLEAHSIGAINLTSAAGATMLQRSLGAFKNYSNHNLGPHASNDGERLFWLQQLNSAGEWYAAPENLLGALALLTETGEFVHWLLDELNLDWLWKEIASLFDVADFIAAFHVPADTDDTSANLAIGAALRSNPSMLSMYKRWEAVNQNSSNVFAKEIVEYAYTPLQSEDTSTLPANPLLDPRTYFFAHDYLETLPGRAAAEGIAPEHLRVITTWMMNQRMEQKLWMTNYSMPENINNVDVSVATNTIYGLTRAVIADLQSPQTWFTTEVQHLYNETVNYMDWAIQSGRVRQRPDIGLLYYPPVNNVYWFASRVVSALQSLPTAKLASLPGGSMLTGVRQRLQSTMQGAATDALLTTSHTLTTPQGKQQRFWCAFLGQADTPEAWNSSTVSPDGDDCVYTSAVAVNALVDTWSTSSPSAADPTVLEVQWLASTPQHVKDAIAEGSDFVRSRVLLQPADVSVDAQKATRTGVNGQARVNEVMQAVTALVTMARKLLPVQCVSDPRRGSAPEHSKMMPRPTVCQRLLKQHAGEALRELVGHVVDIRRAYEDQALAGVQTGPVNEYTRLANSFFSGSIKGMSSLWAFFPTNTRYYLDGTPFPEHPTPRAVTDNCVLGMKGVVSPEEYQKMIENPVFGVPTPTTFDGFNGSPEDPPSFPFWSSPSITRAFSLLALSKVDAVH